MTSENILPYHSEQPQVKGVFIIIVQLLINLFLKLILIRR